MACRVVVDTNVYVSIFQFGGRLTEILDWAVDGSIELFTSEPLIQELAGVLVDKFGWSPEEAHRTVQLLRSFTRVTDPHERIRAARDPDDDRVLECAVEAAAHVIVSGDSDLLDIGSFREIPIMSPRQFLDWMAREGK